MRIDRRICGWLLCGALVALFLAPRSARAVPQQPKKDYLTDAEADQIRDAFTYQKIKYELAHIDPDDRRQGERINDLINAYSGCVDDGDELVGVAVDKQVDVHDAMKIFDARAKDFLPYLKSLEPNAPLLDDYKDTLDDAIEATQDAMSDLADAATQDSSAPIRRKP